MKFYAWYGKGSGRGGGGATETGVRCMGVWGRSGGGNSDGRTGTRGRIRWCFVCATRWTRVPCEVACASDSGRWGRIRWCGRRAMRWTRECCAMSRTHVRRVGTGGRREVQPDMCRHVQIVMNTSRKGKKKKKKKHLPTGLGGHMKAWEDASGQMRAQEAGGCGQMWVGDGVARAHKADPRGSRAMSHAHVRRANGRMPVCTP